LYAQTPDVEEVDQAGLSCPEAPLTMIFRWQILSSIPYFYMISTKYWFIGVWKYLFSNHFLQKIMLQIFYLRHNLLLNGFQSLIRAIFWFQQTI
jgi:hypothetical protein